MIERQQWVLLLSARAVSRSPGLVATFPRVPARRRGVSCCQGAESHTAVPPVILCPRTFATRFPSPLTWCYFHFQPLFQALLVNKLQASHTAARLQEGVGGGTPGYLTDATQVSLLLWVLLQETKWKTSPRDQECRRLQFPQIPVPRAWTGEGRGSNPPHLPAGLPVPPPAPSDPTADSSRRGYW